MNNRISLFVSSSSNEWLYNGDNLFIIGYINYNLYKIMKIIVDYAQILTNEKSARFLEFVFVNISSMSPNLAVLGKVLPLYWLYVL